MEKDKIISSIAAEIKEKFENESFGHKNPAMIGGIFIGRGNWLKILSKKKTLIFL